MHAIHVTHRRVGDVADDGSMRIESQIVSTDEKVKVVTVTRLAPDGLPWLAEAKGTIAKGPVNLNVSLRLEREGARLRQQSVRPGSNCRWDLSILPTLLVI